MISRNICKSSQRRYKTPHLKCPKLRKRQPLDRSHLPSHYCLKLTLLKDKISLPATSALACSAHFQSPHAHPKALPQLNILGLTMHACLSNTGPWFDRVLTTRWCWLRKREEKANMMWRTSANARIWSSSQPVAGLFEALAFCTLEVKITGGLFSVLLCAGSWVYWWVYVVLWSSCWPLPQWPAVESNHRLTDK